MSFAPSRSANLRRLLDVSICLAIVLALGSCEEEGNQTPPLFFPTWNRQANDEVPLGDLAGRLVERNGCLIWSDGADFLPLWPDNYQLDERDLTIAANAGLVLAIGDSGSLGGGERTLEQAESIIGRRIPTRCQPAGGYWLVTEVLID